MRDDSPSVKASIGRRRERIFPVPEYVDPAGKIFMGDHVRIGGGNTIAPRLYYYDGACAEHGIFIGYIGPCLTNTSA
ncbi:hypothetical protein ACIRPU_40205 [Streptomyces sp. NPDC102259]|uniref:hypothetical protein n=1 Tax=Streptomyces sp. NPDC102259 TaxID=3366148 RepID=UPI00380C362B